MRKRLQKWILILGVTSICVFASACGSRKNNQPELVSTLYNDSWVMEKYMAAVQDYDHAIYEQVYFDWGSRSIGPTEYRFRGIVYLTEEEAERLWNDYEWDETDAPQFEFEKVDTNAVGEGPWYSCPQFNEDNYSTIQNNYTVFDGKKLVFDINQT